MSVAPIDQERHRLLSDYAAKSREFAAAVERLRTADGESFIRALDETGTAHRACERSRIRWEKHLAQGRGPAPTNH
jgi:hypothetical protein